MKLNSHRPFYAQVLPRIYFIDQSEARFVSLRVIGSSLRRLNLKEKCKFNKNLFKIVDI